MEMKHLYVFLQMTVEIFYFLNQTLRTSNLTNMECRNEKCIWLTALTY